MIKKHPIIAIATPPGNGGVGIIRISGENLLSLVEQVVGKPIKPRTAELFDLLDAKGVCIDSALALFFQAPASFTGEDVLEIHCHGGQAVLRLAQNHLLGLGKKMNLTLAEPGEFSLRAYLNGKLDLIQAEAIADLILAQSDAAVRGAARSLKGEFSVKVDDLVSLITKLRVLVESTLDFPEEEIDFLENAQARGQMKTITAKLEELLAHAKQGRLIRDGASLVLVGAPNVGKSSLLNCLAGEELAIVTPVAGTTRDRIKELILIDDIPIHVIDTAGLRETRDEIERMGIERTWDSIKNADIVMLIDAAGVRGENKPKEQIQALIKPSVPVIRVFNKMDLLSADDLQNKEQNTVYVSATNKLGIDQLKAAILAGIGKHPGQEGSFMARRRHVEALLTAQAHLKRAEQLSLDGNQSLELFAEELRLAQDALGEITGKLLPDDLLGKIFSEFCIGK